MNNLKMAYIDIPIEPGMNKEDTDQMVINRVELIEKKGGNIISTDEIKKIRITYQYTASPTITRKCRTCKQEFIFTKEEAEWLEDKGLKPYKHCPLCRKIKKQTKKMITSMVQAEV